MPRTFYSFYKGIMGGAAWSNAPPSRELTELQSIISRTKKLKSETKHFRATLSSIPQCHYGQVQFCPRCYKDFNRYLHLVDSFAKEQDRILCHFRAIFKERGWDDDQLIQVILRSQEQQKRALLDKHLDADGAVREELQKCTDQVPQHNYFDVHGDHQPMLTTSETVAPNTGHRGCNVKQWPGDEASQMTALECDHVQEEQSSRRWLAKSFPARYKRNQKQKGMKNLKIKHKKGNKIARVFNAYNRNRNNIPNATANPTIVVGSKTPITMLTSRAPAVLPCPTIRPLNNGNNTKQASRSYAPEAEASLVSSDSSDYHMSRNPSLSLWKQIHNKPPLPKPRQVVLPLSCTGNASSAQHSSLSAAHSSVSRNDRKEFPPTLGGAAQLPVTLIIPPPPARILQPYLMNIGRFPSTPSNPISHENFLPSTSQPNPPPQSAPGLLLPFSSYEKFSCTCHASRGLSTKLLQPQTQFVPHPPPPPPPPLPPHSPLQSPSVLFPPPPPPPLPSPTHSSAQPYSHLKSQPLPPPPPLPSQPMALVPQRRSPTPPQSPPGFDNYRTESPLYRNFGSAASLPINSPAHGGPTAVPLFCRSLPRPSTKMKRLPWKKINEPDIINSIWTDVVELLDTSLSPSIDSERVESLFGQTALIKRDAISEPHKTFDREDVISFLDSKTSLNLSVALKAFKMSPVEVATLIKGCKMSEIQTDRLRALAKVLPGDDMVATARDFEHVKARLSTAEQFCLELSRMPLFRLRVQAMIQADEILPTISRLQTDFELLLRLGDVILNNVAIRHLMAKILELGNFLNTDSYAGNAAGFHLNNLEVIWTTRANNSRVTLLQYLVENEEPDGKVLSFTKELKDLRIAVRLSVSDLIQVVDTLKKNVTNVSQRLQQAPDELKDKFQEFVSQSAASMATLETLVGKVEALRLHLARYFCEKPDKYRIEDCIAIFHTLCLKIDAIHEENALKRQLKQQRQQRLQESADRRQKDTAVDGKTQVLQDKTTEHTGLRSKSSLQRALLEQRGKTNLRDQLMEEIARGDFKLRKRTPGAEDVTGSRQTHREEDTYRVARADDNYCSRSHVKVARRLLGANGIDECELNGEKNRSQRPIFSSGFRPIDEDQFTSCGRVQKTLSNVQEDPTETQQFETNCSRRGNSLTFESNYFQF